MRALRALLVVFWGGHATVVTDFSLSPLTTWNILLKGKDPNDGGWLVTGSLGNPAAKPFKKNPWAPVGLLSGYACCRSTCHAGAF